MSNITLFVSSVVRREMLFIVLHVFILVMKLENNFRANSIASNSILLDPLDVGDILDDDRHNITYNLLGLNPTLHSETRPFKDSYFGGEEKRPELRTSNINIGYPR